MLFMMFEPRGANDCSNVINYERKWNYFISKTNLNENFSIYLAAHCNNQQCIVSQAACVSMKITGELEIKELSRSNLLSSSLGKLSHKHESEPANFLLSLPYSSTWWKIHCMTTTKNWTPVELDWLSRACDISWLKAHGKRFSLISCINEHPPLMLCRIYYIKSKQMLHSPSDDLINLSCVRCEASGSFITTGPRLGWRKGQKQQDEAKGKYSVQKRWWLLCGDVSEKERANISTLRVI